MCSRRWSQARSDGKTAIITGANSGIGLETAADFARRGARVIMACRNLTSAGEVAEMIKKESPESIILVQSLDLASMDSIKQFAKEVLATESRIDILVNNAGVIVDKATTKDGFDMTFGTNHLGTFLLTLLLLDKIKSSSPSRIVIVSSDAHKLTTMNWDDLHYENGYGMWKAYSQSKLANILFTKELAARLQDTGVTVYAVHPGAVRTNILQSTGAMKWAIVKYPVKFLTWVFFKNAKQGAQTSIYCAVSEEVANQTGLYYSNCAVAEPKAAARNMDDARRLWQISLEMMGLESTTENDIQALRPSE